jgi:hypothetical protein
MNRFLQLAVALGVLLAGGGVFYHYIVFQPEVRAKYEECLRSARLNYERDWAELCKSLKKEKDCSLPRIASEQTDRRYNEQQDRCLAVAKAGL